MAGRPSKLTPEIQKRICEAVGTGTPYCLAAQYGGITDRTLYKWLERGREAKEKSNKYSQFLQAIKDSEAQCVIEALARIKLAAHTHWQAAAWYLERRYPQEFGRVSQTLELSGPGGGPIQTVSGKEALEQLNSILAERATRKGKKKDPG